jgi:uncharacterized protein (DUF983 family)
MPGLLKAALECRCPLCREGDLFQSSWYNLAQFSVMNKQCPHCGVQLEPEPGFYIGAMYVSYAFTVAILVAVTTVVYLFFRPASDWVYIGSIIVTTVLLVPLNFRYSRVIFLYWFGGLNTRK